MWIRGEEFFLFLVIDDFGVESVVDSTYNLHQFFEAVQAFGIQLPGYGAH